MAVGGFMRLGARLHAADQSAVTELFEALGERIVTYCFRRTLQARTSVELAELTFLDVWRLRERAPFGDRALEAWVFGLATARCRTVPPPTARGAASLVEPAPDERVLLQWWEWLRTLPEPERDAAILTEWEHLSRRQVAFATHARTGRVSHDLASANVTRPAGLPPPPAGRPMPTDVADVLMGRLLELPESQEPSIRGPRPALALTGLLLAAVLVGAYLLSRVPVAPEAPPSAPDTAVDVSLMQQCRALKGFDPSLIRVQDTGEPLQGLVFFNLTGQVQLCASMAGHLELSQVAQPDASGGSLEEIVVRSGTTLSMIMGGALPNGTLRATVLDNTGGDTRWSGPVWWITRTMAVRDLGNQPPTVFILFDGADATRTWLVPWFGTRVESTHLDWEQAAELCGAALHSDQPVPGLRLLLPGPSARTAGGFLVVSQDERLWTCSVGGAAGWIGGPVSVSAQGGSGVAVSTPQTMNAAQTLVVGGKVPAGVSSVHIELSGASLPAVIDHGYWVWSRVVDNRVLPVLPERITVRMQGKVSRTVVVDWLRDYSSVEFHTWAPLFGTPLGSRCGAGTGAQVESLGGHVQVYGASRFQSGMLCFGTDAAIQRLVVGGFPASLAPHVLAEPDRNGSRLYAAGGALPAGVSDIVLHTPAGPVAAQTAHGYWVLEWAWPGHPRATLPASVRVTWTQDGRPMSRTVRLPSS